MSKCEKLVEYHLMKFRWKQIVEAVNSSNEKTNNGNLFIICLDPSEKIQIRIRSWIIGSINDLNQMSLRDLTIFLFSFIQSIK